MKTLEQRIREWREASRRHPPQPHEARRERRVGSRGKEGWIMSLLKTFLAAAWGYLTGKVPEEPVGLEEDLIRHGWTLVTEKRGFAPPGWDMVYLNHSFFRDEHGEELVTPAQMRNTQREVTRRIREREGLLTIDEIKALREWLKCDHEEFARFLDVRKDLPAKWERGSFPQDARAEACMRRSVEWMEACT